MGNDRAYCPVSFPEKKLWLSCKNCAKADIIFFWSFPILLDFFGLYHSFFFQDFARAYFPVFGLNTEIYGVNLHIQSEYRKIRTRKTPYLDTFDAVLISGINVQIDTSPHYCQRTTDVN